MAAHAQIFRTATAFVFLVACGAVAAPMAHAQNLDAFSDSIRDDGQMLLEANTLIYDNDDQVVTASGAVRIDYDGNRMVADEVAYDQKTGRVLARGNVAIVDRDGTRVYSDEIDVTDDFKDGFVNALRVETIDKTYFAAESAERRAGALTTFTNGVYTACEPCEEKPDKAPIWRVRSKKIVWNGETKIVRFEQPTFEFFGLPIASIPSFEIADPTVKRKSGFLFPGFGYKKELGAKLSIPYFFALAPTYDLTVTATGYTEQGFLGEAEWRQRFDNGQYSLKIAGIRQNDPSTFEPYEVDSQVKSRWMVGTKGAFDLNKRWSFGWNIMQQSDPDFAMIYDIEGYSQRSRPDKIYLTGLNERNYFSTTLYRFNIQETAPEDSPAARDPLQPWVLPSVDYSYVLDQPIGGGQLSFDVNTQVVYRDRNHFNPSAPAVRGIDGTSGRVTAETEWKRSIVAPGGVLVTPVLHARADGIGSDPASSAAAAIGTAAGSLTGVGYSYDGSTYGAVATDIRSSYYRAMATAGFEVRWPVLFSTSSATHVLEPTAQLFVRPDAQYQSSLGIPNEDAQSLVFDAASLFERDKFSGYDRIEGGTRANVGLRYSGSFSGGWTANAIVGQSYHLAGDNPYASPDLVNAGAYSGLETDRSDYVAMVGVGSPGPLRLSAGARFDEETFEIRRGETKATVSALSSSVTAGYTFIQAQPLYGFANDRREVSLSGRTQFNENWSVFASGAYDIESETLVRSSMGFAYGDECFDYSMTFSRTENTVTKETDFNVGFFLSFRTIGDFGTSTRELASN